MEKPKLHVVSFSGGKDSTAMLLRMIEEKMPIDIILCCDTGLEFPEMYEHIQKVEQYTGREITVLKSEKDYMYLASEYPRPVKSDKIPGMKPGDIAKGKGYPIVRIRWCTQKLKTDVIAKYLKELRQSYDIVEYVGIAADEAHRERDKVYPLIKWGMSEADCLQYCYDRGFYWGGLYEIWDRLSCWCCPVQPLSSLRKLREHRPDLWVKMQEMDAIISQSSQPNIKFTHSLTDIVRRFDVEDEFERMGKNPRSKEFYQTLKERGIKY